MRYFAREIRDGNHKDIVEALEARGLEVVQTFRPLDILIYTPDGRAGWLEIKLNDRSHSKIRRNQIEFMANTQMPVAFVTDEAQAILFAETLEGLSQKQKDDLRTFLATTDKTKKDYHPAVLTRILSWQ